MRARPVYGGMKTKVGGGGGRRRLPEQYGLSSSQKKAPSCQKTGNKFHFLWRNRPGNKCDKHLELGQPRNEGRLKVRKGVKVINFQGKKTKKQRFQDNF